MSALRCVAYVDEFADDADEGQCPQAATRMVALRRKSDHQEQESPRCDRCAALTNAAWEIVGDRRLPDAPPATDVPHVAPILRAERGSGGYRCDRCQAFLSTAAEVTAHAEAQPCRLALINAWAAAPTAAQALAMLERAEVAYLLASGWTEVGGLWRDPGLGTALHIARVAAYKQRQRDQAEANRAAERGKVGA